MTQYSARVQSLRNHLAQHQIQWYFTATLPQIRYLTGFTGSNGYLLIGPDRLVFITDFRYREQSFREITGPEIFIYKDQWDEGLVRNRWYGASRIGFDPNFFTVSFLEKLKIDFFWIEWFPISGQLEKLMRCKDEDEIAKVREAVRFGDEVFSEILDQIRPGVKEMDIAAEIAYRFLRKGAEKNSFDPIVAAGPRAALPHVRPSDTPFRKGDCVVLDFGCFYQGYASDMTRTIFIGAPSEEFKKIYQITLDAQQKAIEQAAPGLACNTLDAVARDYITEQGYGEFFGHSLGHGVGLQVHEDPRISRQNSGLLEIQNVITIEPGIYLPNLGGVRIEDVIVIREKGAENLTRSSKELIVL